MPLIDAPFIYASSLTMAVVIMILLVFIYTTGKLLTSPIQVSLGTVILEYVPICFWSIIVYRLLKYDKAVSEGQIHTPTISEHFDDDYEDRLEHLRDTYEYGFYRQ